MHEKFFKPAILPTCAVLDGLHKAAEFKWDLRYPQDGHFSELDVPSTSEISFSRSHLGSLKWSQPIQFARFILKACLYLIYSCSCTLGKAQGPVEVIDVLMEQKKPFEAVFGVKSLLIASNQCHNKAETEFFKDLFCGARFCVDSCKICVSCCEMINHTRTFRHWF